MSQGTLHYSTINAALLLPEMYWTCHPLLLPDARVPLLPPAARMRTSMTIPTYIFPIHMHSPRYARVLTLSPAPVLQPYMLQGPIYVATQAAALPQVLSVTVPRARHADLVLLQNGALNRILDAARVSLPLGGAAERGSRGRKPEVTQLLLYAAGETMTGYLSIGQCRKEPTASRKGSRTGQQGVPGLQHVSNVCRSMQKSLTVPGKPLSTGKVLPELLSPLCTPGLQQRHCDVLCAFRRHTGLSYTSCLSLILSCSSR